MSRTLPPIDDPGFHRRIALALELEWDLALCWLPEDVRRRVGKPGFRLVRTDGILGRWVPGPVREIQISEGCVLGHPWYAVVDVLRHEIAHQLADELYGETDPPHGAAFRELCRVLRASPKASGQIPTLDDRVLAESPSEDDQTMARIRKLLALSGSPNRHEAERAMAKARELMARYKVDLPEDHAGEPFVSIVLGESALRHGLEMHALADLIRRHYAVRTIWVPMAVPAAGRLGRALEVSGTRRAVQLAHYTFEYIRHAIACEWRTYSAGMRFGPRARRDFALGMISGFRALLDAQVRASPQVRALVHRGDAGLDAYVAERHPWTRSTSRGRSVSVNQGLHSAGEARARRIGLHRGVQPPGADRPRRLLGP